MVPSRVGVSGGRRVRRLSHWVGRTGVGVLCLASLSCGGGSTTEPTAVRTPVPTPAPTPAATPTPIATPTPAQTPAQTAGYYVWGGPRNAQYLGFFTCIFCQEFASDSINNESGSYGSQFSSTSIRNEFSQYGSEFSSYSACNEFASSPPRVYDSKGSTYYGELTLNQFRGDAPGADVANWLRRDVCRH
jgi:hypothetical protein